VPALSSPPPPATGVDAARLAQAAAFARGLRRAA
jgi:hypothetical protein